MTILSTSGGYFDPGRVTAGERDEAVERRGSGWGLDGVGEPGGLRAAGVIIVSALARTYSATGSEYHRPVFGGACEIPSVDQEFQ